MTVIVPSQSPAHVGSVVATLSIVGPPVEEILNSSTFEGIISMAETSNLETNWAAETTKDVVNEILVLIEQEIK